jgi:hypothetical protein
MDGLFKSPMNSSRQSRNQTDLVLDLATQAPQKDNTLQKQTKETKKHLLPIKQARNSTPIPPSFSWLSSA